MRQASTCGQADGCGHWVERNFCVVRAVSRTSWRLGVGSKTTSSLIPSGS